MGALPGDLEGNIVGRVALDLEGARGQVVEVLVQQLETNCELCAAITPPSFSAAAAAATPATTVMDSHP